MRKKQPRLKSETPLIGYQAAGFCTFCLLTLEAKPGRRDVRHKGTLTPEGLCPQAKQARETKKS